MRTWIVIALLLVAGCSKKKSEGMYQLRAEQAQLTDLDKDFASLEVAWLAELSFADRRAALVWPAMENGELIDDDLLYVVFERVDGHWRVLGEKEGEVDARDDDIETRLREALGGEYVMVRPDGYPLDQLGPKLLDATRRFQAAVDKKDNKAGVKALEDYMRGFDRRMMHGGNPAADFLLEVFPTIDSMTITGDERSATLTAKSKAGEEATIPVTLARSGQGWTIAAIMP